MDDRNFDSLARALSGSSPRRQLLRWASGLLAGSVAGVVGRSAAAASCKQASDCPPPADPCKRAVCKDGKCVNRPLPKGTPCDEQTAKAENTDQDDAIAGDETPNGAASRVARRTAPPTTSSSSRQATRSTRSSRRTAQSKTAPSPTARRRPAATAARKTDPPTTSRPSRRARSSRRVTGSRPTTRRETVPRPGTRRPQRRHPQRRRRQAGRVHRR